MSKRRRPGKPPFDVSRRQFIAGAAASSALALAGCSSSATPAAGAAQSLGTLPDPKDSGIDHIVVVMMENRSFDHMLGWAPNADGHQAGLKYPDASGVQRSSFRLSQDPDYGYQACGKRIPDHSYDGGRSQFNSGAMNGWLTTPGEALPPSFATEDLFPIGYFTGDDLPFFKGVVDNFTVCDRYFSGLMASTDPNRVYMHAGQTDRLENKIPYVQMAPSSLPTIWDLMAAKNLSARYYYSDEPYLSLWGAKYLGISFLYNQFLLDAEAGALPSLSYVDPFFGGPYIGVGEGLGFSHDDHPLADVRDGQAFLAQIYNALRNSPQWERTLLIINYDEWGGFYDHVPPPLAPISAAEAALGNDGRLGFRVPCCLIGPRARRGHVSHFQFDPNSILNFIRWRFGLGALATRDSSSLNLAYALDFSNPPNPAAPDFQVPTKVTGFASLCAGIAALPFPVSYPLEVDLIQSLLPTLDPATRTVVEHLLSLNSIIEMAISAGFAIGSASAPP